ncbi:MAG: hypothetical protein FWF57_09190 [Defluviitaleaceae bacterium]|nr:hypothetical protein [Defluviitaleaceae bacterium]
MNNFLDTNDILNEYQKKIFGTINKKIYSFVIDVLNKNEYIGSPIYEDFITKEYLHQLIEQVVEIAKNNLNDIEEIILEDEQGSFSRFRLLRAIIEVFIIKEIFSDRIEIQLDDIIPPSI